MAVSAASVSNITTPTASTSQGVNPYPLSGGAMRNGRPTMTFVEEIDFCLQPSTAGSGACSKMSKTLNTLSNHIAKKILIGVDFCFGVSGVARSTFQPLVADIPIPK